MNDIVDMREPISLVPQTHIALAEHAAVIRALGKRVVGDIIEIGRRLTEAKRLAGHGGWLPWLDDEFGWTDRHARNFMSVYEMASKSEKFSDLNLSVSGLYLLAAPSTPEEAREAVIERAKNGEALSVKDVQQMIAEARDKQEQLDREQRERDHAAVQQQIADLKVEAKQREDAIRAEYADKIVVSPESLAEETEKAIRTALAPLQQQLEKAERKLELAEQRLNASKSEQPKIDTKLALASTGIQIALRNLAAAINGVKPEQVIEIEAQTATITKQTVTDRLGGAHTDAKRAAKWLTKFVTLNLGDSNE